MPLQKVLLKPGVNRENTRYTNEGGWYESDKVRFRQGTPEKIGGWAKISANKFVGICRSLWNWTTLTAQNLLGVGTTSKFYIEENGTYYDITPIRSTNLLGANPFATTFGLSTVVVTDTAGGFSTGDYVSFFGATAVAGITISGEYLITKITAGSYSITASSTASATTTGGGSAVYASYPISTGGSIDAPANAWGGSTWSDGNWGGVGISGTSTLRIWTQYNFGQNLILGTKLGPMYYWSASTVPFLSSPTTVTISSATPAVVTLTSNTAYPLADGTAVMFTTTGELPAPLVPETLYYVKYLTASTFNLSLTSGGASINTTTAGSGVHSVSKRAVPVSSLTGASDVPLSQYTFIVSDASRFTIVFGTNDYLSTTYDPMLIRWSAQESVVDWTPSITNQAGSVRLSHGSLIQTVLQARQEILVFTDAAVYSMQYLGPPYVWGTQLLSDNISIASMNAAAYSSGVAYWMGTDKFYKYDGRVQTLRCDLRQYIYDDINKVQIQQVFAGTNEGFNEVWWFYCSSNSSTIDRYVVYNYVEDVWYYGSMARTAWLDTSLRDHPVAATYSLNIVNHEQGVDDATDETTVPITSFITSAQFDIGDGNNFAFVYRMLPDLTFRGSTDGTNPSLTIQLLPLQNSGSGYNDPKSIGGTSSDATQTVSATQSYPIDLDTYNGQINIRVRGRQMSMKVLSNTLGTQWQLGAPRIDLRPDGRRGG